MGITRGAIKFEILTRLQKTARTKGYYTDPKMNSAIAEAMDYVATEMMLADEGWNHKIDYVDVPSGTVAIPMKSHWSMIAEVRFLSGDAYSPLGYDQNYGGTESSPASGETQSWPGSYRIIDNQLYFNPAINAGGDRFIQVEYFCYPSKLLSDNDTVDPSIDRAMFWFIVYHSVAMLGGQVEQTNDSLQAQEAKWLGRIRDIISMRTRQVIPVRDFEG